MKSLRYSGQFNKDLKLAKRRGWRIDKLLKIVEKLQSGQPLSPIDDDHPLKGPWDSYRGCHVQGDWCLIYQITKDELLLARTGTHADLFE
jgi:mRNA interferase YafQ